MKADVIKPVLTREERKARRELRREKQRLANVGRAQKMHVERIAYEKTNSNKAPATFKGRGQQYFAGCSGWFYWHWRETFYSADMPTSAWFRQYAEHFRTVELNAPFYAWPTLATVKTWQNQAADRDFVYTVKVCELITHVKRFKGTKTLIRDFGLIADLLGPRMGCFLFQLPPSFHYTAARLQLIVSQLDHQRRNVVEFRHPSWWNERVFAAFRAHGTIFCSCSGPRLPDDLVKTADDIYARFHGTKRWYMHDYTDNELQAWARKIKRSKAKRVWAYFNNDRNGNALRNARTLLEKLQSARGKQ